jgi:uncharacterized protein
MMKGSLMPVRRFLKKALSKVQEKTLLTLGNVTYQADHRQGSIEITHVELSLPRLPQELHGYCIVHISDIHKDSDMPRDYLVNMVEKVNQQQPDVIALTGDIVTGEPERYADVLIATLGTMEARDAKVVVFGNHDHPPWSNAESIRHIVSEGGFLELNNVVCTIEQDDARLYLAGVDDVCQGKDRLDLVLRSLPDDGQTAILLCHEPDFADVSGPTGRFSLQLSGHSHGGQILFPGFVPPILPKYAQKYPSGLYQIHDMFLYTNRGLGHPRVRFNCRPEITILSLLSVQ